MKSKEEIEQEIRRIMLKREYAYTDQEKDYLYAYGSALMWVIEK